MSILSSTPARESSTHEPLAHGPLAQEPLGPQLALTLKCRETEVPSEASGPTILTQRYMSYPLSVSPIFRLDERGRRHAVSAESTDSLTEADYRQRAYLYRMNTSPGLLAGDVLGMSIKLESGSSLLLADQAATKVHTMPVDGPIERRSAKVHYSIEVGDRATLEFLPEPLILFKDAALKQTTHICLHPSAGLSWGEIILPGRLARGERYQFQEYWSRTQISSSIDHEMFSKGEMWFTDAMKLLGKQNPFVDSPLFASGSVFGSLILVLPETVATPEALRTLSQQIDRLSSTQLLLEIASSVLPKERGLFVRAIAHTTRDLQSAFKSAANYVRQLRNQLPLPYSF